MTSSTQEVAVVTGAGAGLGRGIALELAARGTRVVVTDMDDSAGSSTVASIEAIGGEAVFVHVDAREPADLQAALETAASRFGPVTVVVANVNADGGGGRIWEHDLPKVRQLFDVLVYGTFVTVHASAPTLIESAAAGLPARLLIVGSEHSLGVPPHVFAASAYTTAKYATLGLLDTARRDFEGTGVSTTLLAPSWVRTEKVRELVRSSHDLARAIEPHAQNTDVVAKQAIDGLLAGDYIVATNPVIRQFALDHARGVMAAVQMLPVPTVEEHAHDGTGDAAKCPVIGPF
jgi:NAD(P)-dependent dehydrogenase (short-subunit alcohol dehydrogenase family)